MKTRKLFSGALALFLFSFCSLITLAQAPLNIFPSDQIFYSLTSKANAEQYALVYIYYPVQKSGSGFTIYLNRKSIGKITNGGRLECRLLIEGPLAITLIDGNVYSEPLTQSRNSRTISIKKGKSYYFRVSGNNALEYILSTEKGEKNFTDANDYLSQPISFIESPGAELPSLQAGNR